MARSGVRRVNVGMLQTKPKSDAELKLAIMIQCSAHLEQVRDECKGTRLQGSLTSSLQASTSTIFIHKFRVPPRWLGFGQR